MSLVSGFVLVFLVIETYMCIKKHNGTNFDRMKQRITLTMTKKKQKKKKLALIVFLFIYFIFYFCIIFKLLDYYNNGSFIQQYTANRNLKHQLST